MAFDPTKYGAKPVAARAAAAGVPSTNGFPVSEPAEVKQSFMQKVNGFAGSLGVQKFGQGVSTLFDKSSQQTVSDIGEQETESQRMLIEAIRKETDQEKKKKLVEFLKKQYGVSYQPTAEELNAGFGLSDKEFLGSAANVALLATSGGTVKAGAGKLASKVLPGKVVNVANKTAKALQTTSMKAKIAKGAAEGYAFDVANRANENQDNIMKPGFGTGVGASIPVAGGLIKVTAKLAGRLLKGIGSGLSGVGTNTIDEIMKNPKKAREVSNLLSKKGNANILKKNAEDIVQGVSGIKKEARGKYAKGLEALSKTDIDRKTFKAGVQEFLDSSGSVLDKKSGLRTLSNVEFDDPKNIKKASALIDKLEQSELDGKSLRKLVDDIESSVYKTAVDSERLSYNAWAKELASTVKSSISKSTDKLDDINKAFSNDMQLAEAVEDIFGSVKFKNLSEVNKASQKLESLFNQKGLSPEIVDDFLERAGIGQGLKTSEAVRQIENVGQRANTKGLTLTELIQGLTSSVVTPKMIKELAIQTGQKTQTIKKWASILKLKEFTTAERRALLQMVTKLND